MSKKPSTLSHPSGSKQNTLAGYVAGCPAPPPKPQASTSRAEVETLARAFLLAHRDIIRCPSCGCTGTLSLTSDRLKHLRVQCRGKDSTCNKGWTAANFLKWAEPLVSNASVAGPPSPSPVPPPSSPNSIPGSIAPSTSIPPSPVVPPAPVDVDPVSELPESPQTPPTQLGKRVHSGSPSDALPSFRPRLASPSMDPRDSEILFLRETIVSLRDTVGSLQTQLTSVLDELKAVRALLPRPPAALSCSAQVLSGPTSALPDPQPTQPAPALPQPMHLDPAEFPPLPSSPLRPTRSQKGKAKAPVAQPVPPLATTFSHAVAASAPAPPLQPSRTSYSQVGTTLGLAGEELLAAIQAISNLSRRPPQVGKDGSKLFRVYVQGIGRMPIGKVRSYLKDLRFRVSRILNISFLGSNTAEFLLTADYVGGFKRRVETIGQATRWRILDTFDAAAMADPKADPATRQRVQDAFLKRVQQIILKTRHPAVKANYEAWLRSLDLPLPSPTPVAVAPGASAPAPALDGQPGPSVALVPAVAPDAPAPVSAPDGQPGPSSAPALALVAAQ